MFTVYFHRLCLKPSSLCALYFRSGCWTLFSNQNASKNVFAPKRKINQSAGLSTLKHAIISFAFIDIFLKRHNILTTIHHYKLAPLLSTSYAIFLFVSVLWISSTHDFPNRKKSLEGKLHREDYIAHIYMTLFHNLIRQLRQRSRAYFLQNFTNHYKHMPFSFYPRAN